MTLNKIYENIKKLIMSVRVNPSYSAEADVSHVKENFWE